MNGRIYDPRLARFLQADPLIEDGSTLNRYTYVHNNPLAYTDPSGYLSQRAERFLRTAVAVAISVWSGGALSGAAWAGVGTTISSAGLMTKLAFAMSNGLLAGAIQSGTVEGAAWGAFSAGVFFGIGQGLAGAGKWAEGSFMGTKLSGAGFAVKTVSHGLAGGAISHLQGGKFGHGFASAAGSAATAPLVDASSANVVQGAVVATLVGGTLSRISGGNFANGALTAAMSYAFNQVASGAGRKPASGRPSVDSLEDGQRFAFSEGFLDGEHHYGMASPQACSFIEVACTFHNLYNQLKLAPVSGVQIGTLGAANVIQVYDTLFTGRPVGYVTSITDPNSFSITNSTTQQHIFRYGSVTRSVGLSSHFGLRINTEGVGRGLLPPLNNWAGLRTFASIDQTVIQSFRERNHLN